MKVVTLHFEGSDLANSTLALLGPSPARSTIAGPVSISVPRGLAAIENGIQRRTDLPVFTDALADAGYTNIMVESHRKAD